METAQPRRRAVHSCLVPFFLASIILTSRLSAQEGTPTTNQPPKLEPWQIAGMRAAFGDTRVPYAESSWDVQREALKICAELGWGPALDAHEISGYLPSLDEIARHASVKALGQCGKEASFSMKDLTALLTKGPPDLSEEASNALCQMAVAGAPAADEVAVLLESNDADIRARGAVTLGGMGRHAGTYAKRIAELLHDTNSDARIAAARALSQMGEDAWPFAQDLAHLLQDPNPVARSSAVVALSRSEDNGNAFAAQMAPLVEDQDEFVRLVTVSALAEMKDGGEVLAARMDSVTKDFNSAIRDTAIKALAKAGLRDAEIAAKLLGQPDPRVRRTAIAEFSRLAGEAKAQGPLNKDAVSFVAALSRNIENRNTNIRCDSISALEILGEKGPKEAAAIAPLLTDRDSSVRLASAKALCQMGRAGAAYAHQIVPLLDEDDQPTRVQAILALRYLGQDAVEIAPDLAALLGSQKANTRMAVLSVFDVIGAAGPEFTQKIAALRQDPELEVRCFVAFVLADLDHGAHADAVAEMLKDEDAGVRGIAAHVLSQMGKAGFPFAPAVSNLLGDHDPSVRANAVRCLGKMGRAAAAFSDRITALQTDSDDAVRSEATEALENVEHASAGTDDATLLASIPPPPTDPPRSAREFAFLLDAPDNSRPPVRPTVFNYFNSHGNVNGDLDLQAALLGTVYNLKPKKVAERRAYLRIWAGDNEELQRSVTWLARPDVEPMPKEGLPPEELRKTFLLFSNLWDLRTLSPALRDELGKRIEQVTKAAKKNPDAEIARLSSSLLEKLKMPVAAPGPADEPTSQPHEVVDPAADRGRQIAVETLQGARILDAATDKFAIEWGVGPGTVVFPPDLRNYVKKGSGFWLELFRPGGPKDPFGQRYVGLEVDKPPTISRATFDALKNIADRIFWGAYAPDSTEALTKKRERRFHEIP